LPDILQYSQRYRVLPKQIVVNKKYSSLRQNYNPSDPDANLYDFALVELERPLQFSENVKALEIVSSDFTPDSMYNSSAASALNRLLLFTDILSLMCRICR